ncbi:acyl-CoA dehydrogenase family protein [Marinibaculum pumilum]|uniref:Acyl-CoA dehydrogenase family protein n=1 Tax=Marinibaculum pumilum TaxID=1766165 RepID=A0ABV7L2U3_9PROT
MSELQSLLRDTAERLFADRVTPQVLHAAEDGGWPAELWQVMAEHGLHQPFGAGDGEEAGEDGADWSDLFALLFAAGRWAVPLPLGETAIAGRVLLDGGLTLPDGPLGLAAQADLSLDQKGRVGGTAAKVPWGAAVPFVVARAGRRDGAQLVLLPTDGVERRLDRNIAREPRDDLSFEGVVPAASCPWPADWSADRLRDLAALLRAAQIAGAMDRVLDITVGYAGERKQFGRPIGKFQAIQHQLAELAGEAAAAAVAAQTGFAALDEGRDPWFAIAVAKQRASEAAGKGAAISHQVHGAIGFTYEHHLHYLTRRLWSWRTEFGNARSWATAIGARAAGRGATRLWPDLVAGI